MKFQRLIWFLEDMIMNMDAMKEKVNWKKRLSTILTICNHLQPSETICNQFISDSLVIKSGTDFFDFSELQIELKSDSSIEQVVTRHTIDMTSQPDIEMFDLIDQYQKALQASLNISIGIIKVISPYWKQSTKRHL